ncbi:MAG: sigma-70 family RNA polymerase sigma factor, partial [Planctomycetales bacterium]|nr:sigma-70 family RNA polymerase sigma factor [Planctomycetales bacterium]
MRLDREHCAPHQSQDLVPPIPSAADKFDFTLKEMFDLAYGSLRRQTRRKLRGFPTVRRWDDTDDVLQTAAMNLCRLLNDRRPSSWRHFYGLVGQQICWTLLSLARKYDGPNGIGARTQSLGDEALDLLIESADTTHLSEEPVQLAEWTEFHRRAGELPTAVADIFHLIWYLDLTQMETAAMLGISEVTVRRHWRTAR